jgi:hypothetical protein
MKTNFILIVGISLLTSTVALAQPTVPPNPVSCSANTCTTNAGIDVCPANGNTVISNFQNGSVFVNNGNSGRAAGSVWRFRNIATVTGQTVNVTITINAIYQAVLDAVDDDAAVDQGNASIASYFAPRIGPDQNLNNTDRRGYVQFTAAFFRNSTGINNNTNADFATVVSLTNLNYVHYDIDGSSENAGNPAAAWFREIGVAQRVSPTNPIIVANTPTELVAYNYTDASINWAGFAGSACERDGVSRCAQVAASYSYNGAQSSITFRMGYDFNADANGYNIGNPVRQYGSRFGCFNFPQQSTLPVKLYSFNGVYRNLATLLNWATDNEVNFEKFEVERSVNGSDYTVIGVRAAKSTGSRANYELTDDLSSVNGSVFYYRLKMIDLDGKFTYSQVVLIRKDSKTVNGVTINPNPVINGIATVKMTSARKGTVELRVVDQSGRVVMKQVQNIYEGNNAITLTLQQLQSGIYTLQVADADAVLSTKFSVIR